VEEEEDGAALILVDLSQQMQIKNLFVVWLVSQKFQFLRILDKEI